MNPAHLGRIESATLLVNALEPACEHYARGLHLRVAHWGHFTPTLAAHLDLPTLAGNRCAWLGGGQGSPWLRLIEAPQAQPVIPMRRHGWLALEVLVGNVDALVAGLKSPWTVLGAPADLEISPSIRAAQVLGPAGELIYLTEVKAPVPPFELPMTDALVDRVFIVVLSTPDRSRTQDAWETLAGRLALAFETKISVLNRELARPLGQRYPVAVLQFREQCLIEIDELELPPLTEPPLATGVHLVTLAIDHLDRRVDGLGPLHTLQGPGYDGARCALWRGAFGERVELIVRA